MGLKYLWDTNTIIYYLQNHFSKASQDLMNNIIRNHQPVISAITQIELLCWKSASENDLIILNGFISDSMILELDNDIKYKSAEIRKSYNVKLPDAIIAATAIVKDLILITNDNRGFKKISDIKLLNPIETV